MPKCLNVFILLDLFTFYLFVLTYSLVFWPIRLVLNSQVLWQTVIFKDKNLDTFNLIIYYRDTSDTYLKLSYFEKII